MTDDFYALLEVPRDASQEEIRDAFREKVRIYHPDHNDDPRANAQFTAVKKAYDTLGDPVERNAYDRMGHLDYVAKRLDGLPDPETWAPSEDDSAGAGGSAGSESAASADSTSTATGSTSTGTSTSSGPTGSRSGGSARGTGGSTTGSSASGRRTASDGAGATARRRTRQPHESPVVSWISRHDVARTLVGWPLLWIAVLVYVAGLGALASANGGAVSALVERVVAAGSDVDALGAALDRGAVPTAFDAALGPLRAGGAADPVATAGGVLFLLGAVLLPAVVALLVYLTRMSPGWRPTYLYVAATLGPLVGLAVGAATAVPLAAELVLVVLLPLGGLVVMLSSAFVRPRVKAALFG